MTPPPPRGRAGQVGWSVGENITGRYPPVCLSVYPAVLPSLATSSRNHISILATFGRNTFLPILVLTITSSKGNNLQQT